MTQRLSPAKRSEAKQSTNAWCETTGCHHTSHRHDGTANGVCMCAELDKWQRHRCLLRKWERYQINHKDIDRSIDQSKDNSIKRCWSQNNSIPARNASIENYSFCSCGTFVTRYFPLMQYVNSLKPNFRNAELIEPWQLLASMK
jgi:hypothetical protein